MMKKYEKHDGKISCLYNYFPFSSNYYRTLLNRIDNSFRITDTEGRAYNRLMKDSETPLSPFYTMENKMIDDFPLHILELTSMPGIFSK